MAEETQARCSSYAWALFALFASFSMSGGGFFMQCVAKTSASPMQANVSGIFIVWSVIGASGLLGLIVQAISSRPLAGIVDAQNVGLAAFAGCLNCCGMLSLTTGIAQDPDSAGPISAMMPFSSVLATILAWAVLEERVVLLQMLGIAICVCGPVLMALADPSKTAIGGLLHGGVASMCLGCFAFSRKVLKSRGAQPTPVVLIICLVAGLAGISGIIVCFKIGRGLAGLSTTGIVFSTGSALCWVFGNSLFQLALAGPVGPADAILNTNSVGVVLLGIVVFQLWPRLLKFVGMLFCIVGVSILVLNRAKVQARSQSTSLQVPLSSESAGCCPGLA